MNMVEVIKNSQGLKQWLCQTGYDQGGYSPLGVDGEIGGVMLMAGQQIYRDFLIRHPLEFECHSDAVGSQGAPKTVELDWHG
jgi:hypothetical protein